MAEPTNVKGIAKATPTGSKVLVLLDAAPVKNSGSYGPESVQTGKVLACGPDADSDQEPGDRVILRSYSDPIEDGGKLYILAESSDVHAKIAGPGKAKRTAERMVRGEFDPKPGKPRSIKVKIMARSGGMDDELEG